MLAWKRTPATLFELRQNQTWRQRLPDWQVIFPQLQSWLDQWPRLLSTVPEQTALAALLFPVVLAILSRQIVVVLGCMVLAVVAFCVFLSPTNTTATLSTGLYLSSLTLALSGIVARRKAGKFQAELASLRSELKRLLVAEERRILSDLRSSSEKRSIGISANPAAGDPST